MGVLVRDRSGDVLNIRESDQNSGTGALGSQSTVHQITTAPTEEQSIPLWEFLYFLSLPFFLSRLEVRAEVEWSGRMLIHGRVRLS
jgi:hypothetical protein